MGHASTGHSHHTGPQNPDAECEDDCSDGTPPPRTRRVKRRVLDSESLNMASLQSSLQNSTLGNGCSIEKKSTIPNESDVVDDSTEADSMDKDSIHRSPQNNILGISGYVQKNATNGSGVVEDRSEGKNTNIGQGKFIDMCMVCAEPCLDRIVICDHCESAQHLNCASLKEIPQLWICEGCVLKHDM